MLLRPSLAVINMAVLQGSITLRLLFTFCKFLAQKNLSVKLSKYQFTVRPFAIGLVRYVFSSSDHTTMTLN